VLLAAALVIAAPDHATPELAAPELAAPELVAFGGAAAERFSNIDSNSYCTNTYKEALV
jgi:hypothetical protein